MTTPRLRGRAAQPLRPGFIVKSVLSGDIPLATGESVKEAAVTDIHSVYKFLTKQENLVRPRDRRLRGMTYASFITMFRFARYLGLVERVREEPMLFPPPGKPLLSIRKPDGAHVVESKRVIYRLTQIGVEDEVAWSNLRKAWAENWPVPQKAVEIVPPIPEVMPPPKVEKPVRIEKMLKLSVTPSLTQFNKLLKYLRGVRDAEISGKQLREVLDKLSGRVGDWDIWTDDALEDAKEARQKDKITRFTLWSKHIKEAVEGFLDEDLPKIIRALERLV